MYRRRHRHNLDSVTIGRYAGEESNTENTVSVGRKAGYSQQKQWAIAIGDRAGEETQDLNAIAIGILAGQNSQSTFAIAIGNQAGRTTQSTKAIAIGGNAGQSTQSTLAMAIGENAGQSSQGTKAIAIGENAGQSSQGTKAIAIGENAGQTTQGANAIAIGENAGQSSQGTKAIAIGENAGQTAQGANAIAIGNKAGVSDQPEASIIISTSDTEIMAKKKGLYIDPIRKFDDREARPATVKEGNVLSYNYQNDTENATKEVVTGFPRLPVYPTDAEVLLAFTEAKKGLPPPVLGPLDNGTMYFDSTKKKVKVYNGTKWIALADEDDIAKLMAAIAAMKSAGSSSGGASLGGKLGYVPGSPDGATQSADAFMTGGGAGTTAWSMGATSGNPVTVVGPDGQAVGAIPGVDFYWDDGRKIGWENGYYPVFYKDINVVSERVPDSPDNVPGYYVTTYDNGHITMEQKPTADWNPPLDAFNQLPIDQRRAVLDDYCNATGTWGMTSPVGSNELGRPDAFEGVPFRNFLESKGLGK